MCTTEMKRRGRRFPDLEEKMKKHTDTNSVSRIEAAAKDVIVRCDEITAFAKKPDNRLSECFALPRTVSFNETCAEFLSALAECDFPTDVQSARKTLVRMKDRVMLANNAIADRLGDDSNTLDGVVCCEKTFFKLLINGDSSIHYLVRFAASHLTLVRIVLTASFANVRKQLESIERHGEVKIGTFSFKALQQLITAIRGRPADKAEALDFMRGLYDLDEPKFNSCHKVVDFVRTCRNADDPYFNQCARIRTLAKTFAKKVKGGEEKVWRSFAQELQPAHAKARKSKFFS